MITHAMVPVSVSKYAAIVGSATFTIEPSIPSITTPRATADKQEFLAEGIGDDGGHEVQLWGGEFHEGSDTDDIRNMPWNIEI